MEVMWTGLAGAGGRRARWGTCRLWVDRLHPSVQGDTGMVCPQTDWALLKDPQGPAFRRQLGVRAWPEMNPVGDEMGGQ